MGAVGVSEEKGHVLEPVERLSEVLFGLIMALTFTGSIHAAGAGREEYRTMLFGAIGCNIAWGIVDAVMYVLTDLVERNRGLVLMRALRAAPSPQKAHALIVSVLPDRVAEAIAPAELETLRIRLEQAEIPHNVGLTRRTLRGALGVFLLVALSTFPLVLPFLVVADPVRALRISHAIALAMLFFVGSAFGKYSGQRPIVTGLGMVSIGVVLVLLTIALGG